MKLIPFASVSLLLTGWALCGFTCTQAQEQEASSVVSAICAVAAVGSVAVAADGSILNVSAANQAKVATGTQLIPVNCTATQAAIAAIAAASAASPTALVAEENRQAVKLHIDPALLRKVVAHYSK